MMMMVTILSMSIVTHGTELGIEKNVIKINLANYIKA